METVWQDIRFALRGLRKSPLVTALAALSLGLAVAGNTVVFSLVSALIYRPLPYPEPDRIVLLGEREEASPPSLVTSGANLLDWQERNRSFSAMGGYRPGQRSLGTGDQPEAIAVAHVSPAFMELLGARTVRGRVFAEEEAAPGGDNRVAVVSQAFRERRMEQELDPVGSLVVLNGEAHTVIGVLAADFEFFGPPIEVWLPLVLDRAEISRDRRDTIGVARLRPGVEMAEAKAEMAALAERLASEFPESNRGYVIDALNMLEEIPDSSGRALLGMLQGAVVLVLLIACANVANLLLARGQERRQEIALRTILGAGRGRILRQLLTESVVLAGLGGVLGVVLGGVGIRVMAAEFAPVLPAFWAPALDVPVLVFTLALSVGAGLLFGLAPALASFRLDLAGIVKEGGRGAAGPARRLLTRGLVVAEIAMSLTMLGGASVLVRSFLDMRNADRGFDSTDLLTAPIDLPARLAGAEQQAVLLEQIEERLGALPGVTGVAAVSSLPLNVQTPIESYTVDEQPMAPGAPSPRAIWIAAPPSYLQTMRIPLLQGRFFTRTDRADAPAVVAVNQALAERHWPERDPIGQRLTFRGVSREVVGVVANTRQSLIRQGEGVRDAFYLPLAQLPLASVTLLVRSEIDARGTGPKIRSELRVLDSQIAVGRMQTFDEFVDQVFVGANVFSAVLSGFGALALLLASLGTYGVLAYGVAQRRQEIAVRMAIGAQRGEVLKMITRQGVLLGAVGLALGAPGVVAVTWLIDSLLVAAPPVEWLTLLGVVAVLLAATLLASFVPARRAASMEPVRVLRYE